MSAVEAQHEPIQAREGDTGGGEMRRSGYDTQGAP